MSGDMNGVNPYAPQFKLNSVKYVFDKSVKKDDSCLFSIQNGYIDPLTFDDQNVRNWGTLIANPFAIRPKTTAIQIPTGWHTVTFHYYPGDGRNLYNLSRIFIAEKGKNYILWGQDLGSEAYIGVDVIRDDGRVMLQ